jgi:pyruvate kinase
MIDRPSLYASWMRRTKIVATLGPATQTPKILSGLVSVGADVFRLNFSHGTPDEHAKLVGLARAAAEREGREVGLLADLPGPKLRLGEIEGDVLQLRHGQPLRLTSSSAAGRPDALEVAWAGLPSAVERGDMIYLADGAIRLRVVESDGDEVLTRVETGGTVTSHQGLNLPGVDGGPQAVSERDLEWVDFAVDHGMDLIAVSFVRSARDLEPVNDRLRERKVDTPVIAKIERREAAAAGEEIVQAAGGGIMVARGDLGIELPIETIPLVQKRLLSLAGRYSKPSITATQMLASMVGSPRPTRAEVTDVANAIFDGTDALMLSEETAVGQYPIEAVRTMARIAEVTEQELPYGDWLVHRARDEGADVAETVSHGAVAAAYRLGLAALVVPTRSGRTARLVSAYRPRVPVLALSPRIETVRRLNLLFGVRSILNEEPEGLDQLLSECAARVKELGLAEPGDLIGITAGLPSERLGTNLLEVHRVP